MDLKTTTFGVCSRLDQADSDWEQAACLYLTAKRKPPAVTKQEASQKKRYALRGNGASRHTVVLLIT